MEKYRILLAEDHAMVREGLKALINSQTDMTVIGEAEDGRSALQQAKELQPHVVVMDVSMPKMNGQQATTSIVEECPSVKVLVLTRYTDRGFIQQLFRAGASGYILKQSQSAQLVNAIRIVAEGNNYLDPAITGKVISGYVGRPLQISADAQNALSEREEDMLKMIAWGYSNKEIAAQFEVSLKTVEAHKANAMKKLDLHSRIDIVRYALLQGWLVDT